SSADRIWLSSLETRRGLQARAFSSSAKRSSSSCSLTAATMDLPRFVSQYHSAGGGARAPMAIFTFAAVNNSNDRGCWMATRGIACVAVEFPLGRRHGRAGNLQSGIVAVGGRSNWSRQDLLGVA